MKVSIEMIEEHTDEKKFAERVAETMQRLHTTRVKYSVTTGEKGYLYTAMVIKIKRF